MIWKPIQTPKNTKLMVFLFSASHAQDWKPTSESPSPVADKDKRTCTKRPMKATMMYRSIKVESATLDHN